MSWQENLALDPQILVVCTGNICRSPMGEVVLKKKLMDRGIDMRVFSAGVSNEEEGNPIHPLSARVLREHGYRVPLRGAQKTNESLLEKSGLIIAMTQAHAHSLRTQCERFDLPVERIYLWREFSENQISPNGCFAEGGLLAGNASSPVSFWDHHTSLTDVPDPWSRPYSAYVQTFEIIERGADILMANF